MASTVAARLAKLQELARFLEENPLMPFSVVDARAPLAAAASADVERGAKASSSAAKLSAARADVLLLSVIGADDESPAIAAVMIDAEKTAAHAVAAAGSSHMGVLGTSVADSGRRMAVAY